MNEYALIDLLFKIQRGEVSCRCGAKTIIDTMLKENDVMREALVSICHLYKVNAVEKAPYIAREALDKIN